MAKTSEEEIQLRKRARRRLVGAIALVVAAIVFLPMLLDTEPEEREQEIDIRIPPEDSAEEFSHEGASPSGASNDSVSATDSLTTEKPPTGTGQSQQGSDLPVKPMSSAEPAMGKQAEGSRTGKVEAETEKSASPNLASGGFVVQLGAFSSLAKARQQVEILASRSPGEYTGGGATVYTETFKADKGSGKSEVTRVRVGPFATREQADAALARLKLEGLDGVVTDK
ncbi:MAG TPA: SPOR domain-containing protein [Nitrosospira sp.]|nr:SPOR domain-containing protein [Nitrosospira sp.]